MKHVNPGDLAKTTEPKGIDPVDLHVGGRVRLRRKALGLSQEVLAEAIGLTFQQVQKYERGSNRISASKLHQISKALMVPVEYFYRGYEGVVSGVESSVAEESIHAFLMTTEGIALAQAFPRIESARVRRRLLEMAQTLAGDE